MRRLRYALALLVILASCVSFPSETTDAEAIAMEPRSPQLYRLITLKDGNIYGVCTAFVAADNRIVTAAHCLIGIDTPVLIDKDGSYGPAIRAWKINPGFAGEGTVDVGVIEADAKLSCPMSPITSDTKGTIIGFPGFGASLATSHVDFKIEDKDYYMTEGMVLEGMSGGPMFDSKCQLLGVLSGHVPQLNLVTVVALNEEVIQWVMAGPAAPIQP